MTHEQIDLEFTHMWLDEQERSGNKQVYADGEYEDYDKESDEYDDKLSDMPSFTSEVDTQHNNTVRIQNEDDWEDVETDDF